MIYFNLLDKNRNIETEIHIKNLNTIYFYSEKLKKVSKHKYLKLIQELSYGISIYLPYKKGDDFVIQNVGKELLKLCGLKSDEDLTGSLFSDTFPVFTELGGLKYLQKCYKTGETQEFYIAIYKDDDILKYYHYKLIKSKNTCYSLAEDESEKKILEEKEQELREKSIQGLVILENRTVSQINKKTTEISGYTLDELNEIGLYNIISKFKNYNPNIKSITEILPNLINNKILFSDSEMEFKAKDGSTKYIKTHTILTNIKKGISQTTFVDITQEKEQEIKAMQLESNLNTIEDIAKIVFISKEQGKYTWTKEIYKILEVNPKDCSDEKDLVYEYMIPEDKIRFKEEISKAVQNKELFNEIYKIKSANGRIKYIRLFALFTEENDYTNKLTGFAQEINKEKENEAESLKLKQALSFVEPMSKFAIIWWNKNKGHEATKEFFNILELNPEEVAKEDEDILLKYTKEEDKNKFKKSFNDYLKSKQNEFEYTLKIKTKNKHIKYLKLHFKSDKNKSEINSYIGYIQDISSYIKEKKKLEKNY